MAMVGDNRADYQAQLTKSDAEHMLFWKGAPSERLDKRVRGTLKGAALEKARVINRDSSLNLSGIYGSIEIDERNFVWFDN